MMVPTFAILLSITLGFDRTEVLGRIRWLVEAMISIGFYAGVLSSLFLRRLMINVQD